MIQDHFSLHFQDPAQRICPSHWNVEGPEEHLQVSCKRCGFMWYTATDDCYVRVDNSDLNNLLKLATKNTTDQS